MNRVIIKIISITLIGAFCATNVFASAPEISIDSQTLSPEIRLSQEQFKERYFAHVTVLAHRAVNEYIGSQIQKAGLDALRSRKDHVWINDRTKKEILIVSIPGLLKNTGQFAHVGLGRKNGMPVIYVDRDYFYNASVIDHDRDEISKWESKRDNLKLDYKGMRKWIKTDPEAKHFAKEFHYSSLNLGEVYSEARKNSADLLDWDNIYAAYLAYGLDVEDTDVNIAAGKKSKRKRTARREKERKEAKMLKKASSDKTAAKINAPDLWKNSGKFQKFKLIFWFLALPFVIGMTATAIFDFVEHIRLNRTWDSSVPKRHSETSLTNSLGRKVILLGHSHAAPSDMDRVWSFVYNLNSSGIPGAKKAQEFKNEITAIQGDRDFFRFVEKYRDDLERIRKAISNPENNITAFGFEKTKQEVDTIKRHSRQVSFRTWSYIFSHIGVKDPDESTKAVLLYLYSPAGYLIYTDDPILKNVKIVPLESEELSSSSRREFYVQRFKVMRELRLLTETGEIKDRHLMACMIAFRNYTVFWKEVPEEKLEEVLQPLRSNPRALLLAQSLLKVNQEAKKVFDLRNKNASDVIISHNGNMLVLYGLAHAEPILGILTEEGGFERTSKKTTPGAPGQEGSQVIIKPQTDKPSRKKPKGSPADLLETIRDNEALLEKVRSEEGITVAEALNYRPFAKRTVQKEFEVLKALGILIPAKERAHYRFAEMVRGPDAEHTKNVITEINRIGSMHLYDIPASVKEGVKEAVKRVLLSERRKSWRKVHPYPFKYKKKNPLREMLQRLEDRWIWVIKPFFLGRIRDFMASRTLIFYNTVAKHFIATSPLLENGVSGLLQEFVIKNYKAGKKTNYLDAGGGVGCAATEASIKYGPYGLNAFVVDLERLEASDIQTDQIKSIRKYELEQGLHEDLLSRQFRFVQGNVETVKMPEKMDIITTLSVLGYTDDPLKAIVNLYNNLKNGGVLVALYWVNSKHKDSFEAYYGFFEALEELGATVTVKTVAPNRHEKAHSIAVSIVKNDDKDIKLNLVADPPIRYNMVSRKIDLAEKAVYYKNDGNKPAVSFAEPRAETPEPDNFTEEDRKHMQDLVEFSKENVAKGGSVIVARIVDSEGRIIATTGKTKHTPTEKGGVSDVHAEIRAIWEAEKHGFSDWQNATIYVNLESCNRCMKTMAEFYGIKRVVYGITDESLIQNELAWNHTVAAENGLEYVASNDSAINRELHEQFEPGFRKYRDEVQDDFLDEVYLRWAKHDFEITKNFRKEHKRLFGEDIQTIVFNADIWREPTRTAEVEARIIFRTLDYLKQNLNPAKQHVLLITGTDANAEEARKMIVDDGIFKDENTLIYRPEFTPGAKTKLPEFDMHVHSTYSDGIFSPAQLIEKARKLGLKALAITDHDSLEALLKEPGLVEEAKALGIEFVPGAEISSLSYHKSLDVGYLGGYWFSDLVALFPKLSGESDEEHHTRIERVNRIIMPTSEQYKKCTLATFERFRQDYPEVKLSYRELFEKAVGVDITYGFGEDLLANNGLDADLRLNVKEIASMLWKGLGLSTDESFLQNMRDPPDDYFWGKLPRCMKEFAVTLEYIIEKLENDGIAFKEAGIDTPQPGADRDKLKRLSYYILDNKDYYFGKPSKDGQWYMPSMNEAIEIVKDNKGFVLLAHPLLQRNAMGSEAFEELIEDAIKHGLDGIEAFARGHQGVDSLYFHALAKKHGLIVTNGSDYHGPNGRHLATGYADAPGNQTPIEMAEVLAEKGIISESTLKSIRGPQVDEEYMDPVFERLNIVPSFTVDTRPSARATEDMPQPLVVEVPHLYPGIVDELRRNGLESRDVTLHLMLLDYGRWKEVFNLCSPQAETIIKSGIVSDTIRKFNNIKAISLHLGYTARKVVFPETETEDLRNVDPLDEKEAHDTMLKMIRLIKEEALEAGYTRRLLLENCDYYTGAKYHWETRFIRQMVRETGCGILVDLGHAIQTASRATYDGVANYSKENGHMEYLKEIIDEDTISLLDEVHISMPLYDEANDIWMHGGDGGRERPSFYEERDAGFSKVVESLRYILDLRSKMGITTPLIVNFETPDEFSKQEVQKLADVLKSLENERTRRVALISPRSLSKYSTLLKKGFDEMISEDPSRNVTVELLIPEKNESASDFAARVRALNYDEHIVQLHGADREKPIVAFEDYGDNVHLLIHRPQEALQRKELGIYGPSRGEDLLDLLKRVKSVSLQGKAMVEDFKDLSKKVFVVPHGFFSADPASITDKDLDITAVGSVTAWGSIRRVSDAVALLKAIKNTPDRAKIFGYIAGDFFPDQHELTGETLYEVDAFRNDPDCLVINTQDIENEYTGRIELTAFKEWLYAKSGDGDKILIVEGKFSEKFAALNEINLSLVDFNVQMYRELLHQDGLSVPRAKVEYAGTLHEFPGAWIPIVFRSPSMSDLREDEGMHTIEVGIENGQMDFSGAIEAILKLTKDPDRYNGLRRETVKAAEKLTMKNIAQRWSGLISSSKGSPADLLMAIRDNEDLLLKVLSKEGITAKEMTGYRPFSRGRVNEEFKMLKDLDILIPAEKPYHYRFSNMIAGETLEDTKTLINSINNIEHQFGEHGDRRPLHRGKLTNKQIRVARRLIVDMLIVEKGAFISKAPELPSLETLLRMYNSDYVRHHAERVERIAALLAEDLGLSEEMARSIRFVAAAHDFGAPRAPIGASLVNQARLTLKEKGIILPEESTSYDIDLFREIKALLGEKSTELDITDIEIDAAQDIFQGPASLDYLVSHDVDMDLLSPAERTAILMHHHAKDLEGYLSQQDWSEEEKEKARILTSILVASDVIENGINHFKKIFFRNTSLIETPEMTLKWLNSSGIPETYLEKVCSSFLKIAETDRFLEIKQDAWKISAEEYENLRDKGCIPYYLAALPDLISRYSSDYAKRHAERASKISELLSRKLGYNEEMVKKIRFSTTAHDFGAPESPIKDDDVDLLRARLQDKLNKVSPKSIALPQGQSPKLMLYFRLRKEFRDNSQNYTPREKAYALDLFRGPAALSHLKEIGISTADVFLTRSQSMAIQYHHRLDELVRVLNEPPLIPGFTKTRAGNFTDEEKRETLIIASILAASDSIENGMNYFKKRFFKDDHRIETVQETKKWIKKTLNIPEPYEELILNAFEEISSGEEFQRIRADAATLTPEEKLNLRRMNRSFSPNYTVTKPKGSPADLLETIRDNDELLRKALSEEGITASEMAEVRPFSRSTVNIEFEILKDLGILVKADKAYHYKFADIMKGENENYTKTMINAINDIRYQVGESGDERPLHRGTIPEERIDTVKELVKMTLLHEINVMQKPVIPEDKVLWHIIDPELLSASQQNSGFFQIINKASKESDARERIYIKSSKESVESVIRKLKESTPNAVFDIALSSPKLISRVPKYEGENEIKILVFEGQVGDFSQIEGIVAALRALHLERDQAVLSLLRIYSAITGRAYEGEIPSMDDVRDFARKFIIKLPPATKLAIEDIPKLNQMLLKLLTAA